MSRPRKKDAADAMRLCDAEALDQEAAGCRMGISRGIIQRLLYSSRKAIIEARLNRDCDR